MFIHDVAQYAASCKNVVVRAQWLFSAEHRERVHTGECLAVRKAMKLPRVLLTRMHFLVAEFHAGERKHCLQSTIAWP